MSRRLPILGLTLLLLAGLVASGGGASSEAAGVGVTSPRLASAAPSSMKGPGRRRR